MSFFESLLPGSDKYDVEEEIGHGAFSEVHRARDKRTGALVALKSMYLGESGQVPGHFAREEAALAALADCPSVVALVGREQEGCALALVLELCTADLWTVLDRMGGAPLGGGVAKAVLQQVLQALAATHRAGYTHRDVAPSNILFAPDGTVRLADFGQARRLGGAQAAAGGGGGNGALTPSVGTRWYKAPELLFSSRAYSPAIDLWSAGCLAGELLTGRPLFPGSSDIDQICRIAKALGSIDEQDWPGVRDLPDWGKLIFPPAPAPPLAELAPGASPAALDLLQGLLRYNPDHRLSAEQALGSVYFREEPLPADSAAVREAVQQALRRESLPLALAGGDGW